MTGLFGQHIFSPSPHPPHNGTAASRDGAAVAAPDFGEQCHRVYCTIRDAGARGATNHEIADQTGLTVNAVCGRTNESAEQGHIVHLDARRESDGCATGVRHQVWVLSPAARAREGRRQVGGGA
jgi:hypothetical protein